MKYQKPMQLTRAAALFLMLALPGMAVAQPSGSSSETPGLVPQVINPDEPTYCSADGVALCGKDEGSARRACLMRNLDKVSKPCHTALTLTPTTGGPGGFGRPIDAQ